MDIFKELTRGIKFDKSKISKVKSKLVGSKRSKAQDDSKEGSYYINKNFL